MCEAFVPERYTEAVALHVLRNSINIKGFRPPLILGIHGPPGEGKTFQCLAVLKSLGCGCYSISSGELESENAGEPAKLIRERYLAASANIERGVHDSAALLFNDFDVGVGDWGELVQTTVNRQLIIGELMHLTDSPNFVEETPTRRIPIILTGNDFTRLYGPLIRHGRFQGFEWVPTNEERKEIIAHIFPEFSARDRLNLIKRLEQRSWTGRPKHPLPLAFYSHLRANLLDDQILKAARGVGFRAAFAYLRSGGIPNLDQEITLDAAIEKGVRLLVDGKLENHLYKGE